MKKINAGWLLLVCFLGFFAGFHVGEFTKAREVKARWDLLQKSDLTDTDGAEFDHFMEVLK